MGEVAKGAGVLLQGLMLTLELFFLSGLLAVLLSLLIGILRLSPARFLRWPATVFVELFRGTSVVVQMFWIYFALPAFGIRLDAFVTAVVALGCCFGAYGSEVVRGAIASVPREQYDAATALNLTTFERLRSVVLPQALLLALPPFTNILLLLLKSTSAASLITIPELTFRANSLNQITYQTVPIFSVVLGAYFVLAVALSKIMQCLEFRCSRWRRPLAMAIAR